jgi:predicted phosphodiesterase
MRWPLLLLLATLGHAGDFNFAILGDRTGGADPAAYAQVWREIDRLHPAFVINVGDVIEGGNDATAAAEWRSVRKVWERYRYPLFFTPGNHDIWSDASRRIYETETGRPPFYSFEYEATHFTVLDNSSAPTLSADQMRFLESDLEAHRERAPKFVFFHQPFWIPLLTLGSGEFPLHRLARKYGVDAVISGHGHQLVTLERDGIRYIEVGSSGARPAAVPPGSDAFARGSFYQYMWVEVAGRTARFTVRELGEPFGRGRSIAPTSASATPLRQPCRPPRDSGH